MWPPGTEEGSGRLTRIIPPPPRVPPLNHEVAPVPVQARAVQNMVPGVEIDGVALHHDPVLVVVEEEVPARLVEEAALDALPPADPLAERRQQLLPAVLPDYHVLVRPRVAVGDRLALGRVGDELHDSRAAPRRVFHVPSSVLMVVIPIIINLKLTIVLNLM